MSKYAILSSGYASPLLHSVSDFVKIVDVDEICATDLRFTEGDVLYVPSEDGLNLVAERTRNQPVQDAIGLFKDKSAFRKKIAPLFPDFFHVECDTDDIASLSLDFSGGRKYVIKPRRGYYATAVKTVAAGDNLRLVQEAIKAELSERAKFYPGGMLSADAVIVEEFIGGDIKGSMALDTAELAVDLYYDSTGIPVIVGLYHHPHPSNERYFHTLYYTNARIFALYAERVLKFFNDLQDLGMNLRSFPMHAEFKVHNGALVPIEVNPYRFGGYGLADLMHHVGGINPYRAFFNEEKADWAAIWKGKTDNYGCIVGYNGESIDASTTLPNHAKFQAFLTPGLLHYSELDHTASPLFGIGFVKTADDVLFRQVIGVDYNNFFELDPIAA